MFARIVFLLICYVSLVLPGTGKSQNKNSISSVVFQNSGDIYGTRSFIENKGQFVHPLSAAKKVYFVYDHGGEKIYFTEQGLLYEFKAYKNRKEEKKEREEERESEPENIFYVNMLWQNSTPATEVAAEQKQPNYFTYGEAKYNSSTYKKLTYKNVYPNIDVEYTIPADHEHGVKYSVIIRPGANLKDFRILYSGDVKHIGIKGGEIIIETPFTNIVEHMPKSYNAKGENLESAFELNKNVISFKVPGYNSSGGLVVIDPWVTSVTMINTSNSAYDVDYDFNGNTFIYGGYNNCKIAKYDNAGSLSWTAGGIISSILFSPISGAQNFVVDKLNGKSYYPGITTNGLSSVIRYDANGNYDNMITLPHPLFTEIWEFGYNGTNGEILVYGGTTQSNLSAAQISALNNSLIPTTFQPSDPSCCQDIVCNTMDANGNIFVIFASGTSTISNHICLLPASFSGNVWTKPTSFNTMYEAGNKSSYQPSTGSNGFNCLAVNSNYLYYYDGKNLAAYSKTTGSSIATFTVPGTVLKRQGGIAVDDCDNLYLGGTGLVYCYNFNGTSFSSLGTIPMGASSPSPNVQDIKLEKSNNRLYVCGSGFVGNYDAVFSASCAAVTCTTYFCQPVLSVTPSVNCASLGSATVALQSGVGPFSYTWLPSGQSGSVVSGLIPGTYTVLIKDAGFGATYTTVTTFTSPVQLSGKVVGGSLTCNGVNDGTAAINISGGSGTNSYLWQGSGYSQTTSIATGLSPGLYTVSVTDILTKCVLTQTFLATEPPKLGLTISSNQATACAGNNIVVSSTVSGGTPTYTILFNGLNAVKDYSVTEKNAGVYIYTVSAVDSKKCVTSKTLSLEFLKTPDITITNATVCPKQTGTLVATGASSYTWNGIYTGDTFTDSPSNTTVYQVYGTDGLCVASQTTQLYVIPAPSAIVEAKPLIGCLPFCTNFSVSIQLNETIKAEWEVERQIFSGSTLHYCFYAAGSYSVVCRLHDSVTTCLSATELMVSAFNSPVADFFYSPEFPIESKDHILFTNNSAGDDLKKFNWFFGDEKNILKNTIDASYMFSEQGNYPVVMVVNDSRGCSDSVIKVIEVLPDCFLYVPDAFSPNKDNLNDIFKPVSRGVSAYRLTIFDRWGEQIFFTTDIYTGWDGFYKGEECQSGVYTYEIQYSSIDGNSKLVSGHIILNR